MIIEALIKEGKLLIRDNEGSISDALYIVGEILGRFEEGRPGYAAYSFKR